MSNRWDKREGDRSSRQDRDGYGSRRERERDRDRDRDRDQDRGRHKDKERKTTRDSVDDDKKPRDDGQRRQRSRSRSGGRERRRDRRRSRDRVSGRREGGNQDREKYRERDRSPGGDRKEKPEGYRNRSPLPDQQASFKTQGPNRPRDGSKDPDEPPKEKEKVNFNNTGLLAAASNTLNTVVLKYTEPVDSRLPPAHTRWRLFTFKDGKIVGSPLDLNSQPAWLVGRDRLVADIPVDHPSCSKQHAVIQFRNVVKKNEYGDKEGGVRPYVVDLESANGTFLNKMKLEDRRFVEMREGDMLVFGESTREYILMMEKA